MKKPIDRIREKVCLVQDSKKSLGNNTDNVIGDIKRLHLRGRLIPVICEDMYEYRNPNTGERQSLHSYIVETIIDKYLQNGIKIELTEKELKDIVNESYYGMTLLRAKIGSDLYMDLFRAVVSENNKINEGIYLKAEVLDFLKACEPPLIVTTNCFPILERELDSSYNSYWYELETKSDTPLPDKCIYHLFGEANPDNSNWGYNDKQLLRFLRSANSTEYRMNNLTTCIGSNNTRKTLLILGNDAPDWLFRFMLTPIYGGDVYDDGRGFYISDENRVEVGGLEQFLREIKFDRDSQLIDVLKKATKKIYLTQPSSIVYDFFVAHASEDTDVARILVKRLEDNGLKVWADYKNNLDGHYWQKIIDALRKSAYFMPLITDNYVQKNKKYDMVQRALQDLNIIEVSLDTSDCIKMEKYLDGVQIELLLASKWLKANEKDPYSIPVILKGSEIYGSPLTTSYIRNMSDNSKYLPQNLFLGINMHKFDASAPESFELDWEEYNLNKKQ